MFNIWLLSDMKIEDSSDQTTNRSFAKLVTVQLGKPLFSAHKNHLTTFKTLQ